MTSLDTFHLSDNFVENFRSINRFEGNPLGEIVAMRSYSRRKPEGGQEDWTDITRRWVEATFHFQRKHCLDNGRNWDETKAHDMARDMFERGHSMKFLPPGRGLFAMGSQYLMETGDGSVLQNCGATQTHYPEDPIDPYLWTMLMLFNGVGVGVRLNAEAMPIQEPQGTMHFVVPDTREGWVEAAEYMLRAFFYGEAEPTYDLSLIRPEGSPIKRFGGTAPGPEPLRKFLERLRETFRSATHINTRVQADIINSMGHCVVSGGVRRSALILGGDVDDTIFINLKNSDVYPDRQDIMYSSNNSLAVNGRPPNWKDVAEGIIRNGEPGLLFMENTKRFGRFGEQDVPDDVVMYNPCAEQSLHDRECCTLVEVFPTNCDSIDDFLDTIKAAYLYGKTVTLIPTWSEKTNEVMAKNRRIGLSISGVVDFIYKHGKDRLIEWLRAGYKYVRLLDGFYSDWLGVPRSIRRTTVKPSGSISKVVGVSAGGHYNFYTYGRTLIELQDSDPLLDMLKEAGFHTEPSVYKDQTTVVYVPVHKADTPTEEEASIWDKLEIAQLLQEHWSDNAVSVTVSFKEDEANEVESVLKEAASTLKTVSMLPMMKGDEGYKQLPNKPITKEEYEKLMADLKPIDWTGFYGDGQMEKFCATDVCEIPL